MLLRDAFVVGVVAASLPVALLRPWIGILAWSWISYMNPHRLTWGFAYDMPLAFAVAAATGVGTLFTKEKRAIPLQREVYILATLWFVFFLSTYLAALYPGDARLQFEKVSKILVATFLTLILFQDRRKIQLLLAVIGLSIGFFGLKGGIWALASGGQDMVLGPPGSFIGGNTEIGLALNMTLPLLLYLRHEAPRRWMRHALLVVFFFTTIAVVFTYSRGALLGLLAVLGVLLLQSKGRGIAFVLLLVLVPLLYSVVPETWFEKMGTMEAYEEDASAMGRIHAWKIAMRIAEDRPTLGAGFRPFTEETARRYMPEVPPLGTDAHNIFFQVLAEHGYSGLVLYVALIVGTLLRIRSIARRARRTPELAWAGRLSGTLFACFAGYLVNGFFLSLSYFDLFYHLVAIVVLVEVVSRKELSAARSAAPIPGSLAGGAASGVSGA